MSQRRQFARYEADLPRVTVHLPDGGERFARVRDESFDGFGLELEDAVGLRPQMPVRIELQDGFADAVVHTIRAHDDHRTLIGLRWTDEDIGQEPDPDEAD